MHIWVKLRAGICRLIRAPGCFGSTHSSTIEAEIDTELRAHIGLRTQENIEAGMKPDEARIAALRQFGWMESVKNQCRDQRRGRWLENLVQDFRFGARQLRKNPAFTFVAILTLGLGVGANSAIFSLINAVLLKPLPYREPDRIMMMWADNPVFNLGIHELPPSQLDVMDWRQQAHSFENIAAFDSLVADLDQTGELHRVGAAEVTANFFSTLGIEPLLGRAFTAEEELPGHGKVVVISHHLWQSEFGADSNLIGKSITLNNERRLVVGIMPAGFAFPRRAEMPSPYSLPPQTDLWVPVAQGPEFWQDDENRHFIVFGRLKAGVPLARAQAEMDALAQRTDKERPQTHTGWTIHLQPLARQVAGQTRPVLFLLLGAVTFVLLIACANVANLLLCRSSARQKEIAIRAAIGADRRRVIRQLLTESVLLALLGGGLGLLLGAGGLRVLLALSPSNLPRLHEAAFDGWVFVFSLMVSLLTGILFGLAPAWQASRVNLTESLNATGRSHSSGIRSRTFNHLVITEVAIAVILLVGAALMLQSLSHLWTQDAGFAKTGVRAFDVSFRGPRYGTGQSRVVWLEHAREQLKALAGVSNVAATSHLPLSGNENVAFFFAEGQVAPPAGREPLAERRSVTAEYFETMRISIVQGRGFTEWDRAESAPVSVVSETLVRKYFPGIDPVGRRIRLKDSAPGEWLTIVGVCRDVRAFALEAQPRPAIYQPYAQSARDWNEMTLVLRGATAEPRSNFESVLRREMKALDPSLSMANFRTIETLVSNALARPRFSSFLLGLFALLALIMTAVGLYGVVAYTVSQRRRELGIRLALGASPRAVLSLVIRQGMRPALLGLGIGVSAAFGLTRFLASQLFEIKPTHPATFAGVSLAVIGVAFFATWFPARRAARIDPMLALRLD